MEDDCDRMLAALEAKREQEQLKLQKDSMHFWSLSVLLSVAVVTAAILCAFALHQSHEASLQRSAMENGYVQEVINGEKVWVKTK